MIVFLIDKNLLRNLRLLNNLKKRELVMKEKIKKRLMELVKEKARIDDEIDFLNKELTLEQLNYESIDFVELIVLIEEEFEIQFKDEDFIVEKLTNYSMLESLVINYVESK